MRSSYPKDRLQPALFDRLEDELGSALTFLSESRRRLDRVLDQTQAAALDALMADERLINRLPDARQMQPFAGLEAETRELVGRVLEVEQARRLELRRALVISTERLRAVVLRDLQNLLNTTRAAAEVEGSDAPGESLEAYPTVRESVVNYGIPPLAGRVRTGDDLPALARAIETALKSYEPRVRKARVRVEDAKELDAASLKSPLALIVEGELWGYPFSEHLQVRTLVDLDIGRVAIADGVEVA